MSRLKLAAEFYSPEDSDEWSVILIDESDEDAEERPVWEKHSLGSLREAIEEMFAAWDWLQDHDIPAGEPIGGLVEDSRGTVH